MVDAETGASLADGELPAGSIATAIGDEFGISQPAVSQHLRVLRDNGFATVTVDGTRRLYAVDPGPLREIDRQGKPNGRLHPAHGLDSGDCRPILIERGPFNIRSAPTSGNTFARTVLCFLSALVRSSRPITTVFVSNLLSRNILLRRDACMLRARPLVLSTWFGPF